MASVRFLRLFIAGFLVITLFTACEKWDCGDHAEELEGDCTCIDGYAYPGCTVTIQELFGTRLVVDSVVADGLGKPWGDLTITYGSDPDKPFIRNLREANLQLPISLDGAYDTYARFGFQPQINGYQDSTGSIVSFQLEGSFTYHADLLQAELKIQAPFCHIIYRLP